MHMVHMKGNRNIYKVLVRKPDRNHLEDLGIEGSIISKLPYLCKSSAHPFRGFWVPKTGCALESMAH